MDAPYPLPSHKPYDAKRVHELFNAAGISLSSWARQNGYQPSQVYLVTAGRVKASRGISHEIALKLGMKLPVEKICA